MLEKIQTLLAEALNKPVESILPETKIVEDLGADSLDVFELLNQLEEDYDIVIPEEDMEGLVTVADVAAVIEKLAK